MNWTAYPIDRTTNELVCRDCGERWPNVAASLPLLGAHNARCPLTLHECRQEDEGGAGR